METLTKLKTKANNGQSHEIQIGIYYYHHLSIIIIFFIIDRFVCSWGSNGEI